MDKKRKYFEEYLKFAFTSIGEKNSEAVVCLLFCATLLSVLMLSL